MCKLSVIIVNYNVEYFLEQCLYSVIKASEKVNTEVFVVDNTSVDGSVKMVKEKFPEVKLIENTRNVGFSKANNQAIEKSKGEYVLLLNPDTLVEEDTFEKVVTFMDSHPDAGGLGVKMIDGKGKFLPESKRGLPTPAVAFYKIFGLSALFPKSRKFGRYHLGYLSNDETHVIEVLSGAFMLLRKKALDQIGVLDEDFFMYGEDIDLSYRITKGGYKNYYFPETRIIHYKGESTKKSSVNYVFVFYNAMVIFAKKHFSAQHAKTFSFFINLAIYLRASIAILMRFIKKAIVPVLDGLLIFSALYGLKLLYQDYTRIDFEQNLVNAAFACYTGLWMLMVYLNGGYDKPVKLLNIARGVGFGTLTILFIYALLPEYLRFSRALIILGTISTLCVYLLVRVILHLSSNKNYRLGDPPNRKFAIVGGKEEFERIKQLLTQTSIKVADITWVSSDKSKDGNYLQIDRLKDIIDVYQINEVIFCGKDIYSHQIIDVMSKLDSENLSFKIAPKESMYIIGSNSINKSGELFVMEINAIDKPSNKRKKRLLDITLAIVFLLGSPFLVWFVENKAGFLQNCLKVLVGKLSWVGFEENCQNNITLPKVKKGIISPVDALTDVKNPMETCRKLNAVYARDYSSRSDFQLIYSVFSKLGQNKKS